MIVISGCACGGTIRFHDSSRATCSGCGKMFVLTMDTDRATVTPESSAVRWYDGLLRLLPWHL